MTNLTDTHSDATLAIIANAGPTHDRAAWVIESFTEDGAEDRNHVDNTIEFFERHGYSADFHRSVYMTRGDQTVAVNAHNNGASLVMVNALALVPVIIINRQTGEVNIWK